jgi:hypothetical protein
MAFSWVDFGFDAEDFSVLAASAAHLGAPVFLFIFLVQ